MAVTPQQATASAMFAMTGRWLGKRIIACIVAGAAPTTALAGGYGRRPRVGGYEHRRQMCRP